VNSAGLLMVILGVWLLAQILAGGLLTRLNIINSNTSSGG